MKLIKNRKERNNMIEAGRQLASIFNEINFLNMIDKSTAELDQYIKDLMQKYNVISCCKGYNKFSGWSCISINQELVHGVPKKEKIIKETDMVTVDICISYNGFCADAARTFAFFEKNELYQKMNECAKEALNNGIKAMKQQNTIKSISRAIEKVITDYGYSVVKDFCGHGIGKYMHEDPYVPNFEDKEDLYDQKIYVGMALAIEPMFCQYSNQLIIDENDGWTAFTKDGGLSMHIEDTVLLDDNELIITTRLK